MTSGVKALGGTLTHAAAGGLKIFTAGVGAAATGLSTLGVAAIKNYANYEQLVGGVETLFGAGGQSISEYAGTVGKSVNEVTEEYGNLMTAQNEVMKDAAEAYRTAGLSANDYMETVTGFAASLKQSTSSELEAAKSANQAVVDMADNANKMGTSMDAIQYAYQGFAKQNYTMLDNLKLGYGGTKEEMQRLLEDATKLSGVEYDISSLKDVYEAIHVIQTELGVTGTTAKEASTTISGSLNAMKASWENLVTGMADDDADFDVLVQSFVETATTAAENILPRIEIAIGGIGDLIDELLPVVMDKVPQIIGDVLPDLVDAGVKMTESIVQGVVNNTPQLISYATELIVQFAQGLSDSTPEIIETAGQVLSSLKDGIVQAAPELISAAAELITTFAQGIIDNLPELMDAAQEIADAILDGIGDSCPALEPVTDVIKTIINNLDDVALAAETAAIAFVGLKAGMAIQSAVKGFQEAKLTIALFKASVEGANIAQAALNGTLTLGETAVALFTGQVSLAELATAGLSKAQGILNAIMSANPIALIVIAIAALIAIFVVLWNKCDWFREFWINLWESVKETASNVIDAIVGFFTETIPNALENLKTFVTDNWKALLMLLNPATALAGIFKLLYDNCDSFRAWVDQAWNSIVTFFTEQIPAFFQNIIDSIAEWGENAKETIVTAVTEMIENVLTFFSELPEKLAYWLGYAIGSLIKFGQDAVKWAVESVPLIIENIITFFSELPGKIWKHLQKAISNISKWKDDTIQKAAEAGEKFISNVVTFFSELPEKIRTRLHEAIDNISKWKKETVEKAKAAGKEFVSNVVTFFSELPGKIWNHLSNVLKKIVTFKNDMTAKAREAAKGFFDKIVDGIKSLPDKMQEIGSNIVQGVWKGISAGWDWLVSSVQNLANSLFQGVKDALGIHSPSRKFKWIGEMCVAGLDEPLAEYNPYDTALKSLKVNEGTLASSFAVTAKNSYGVGTVSHSDYRKMADAMTTAFERVGFKVEIGRRDFGRLVCEVS